MNRIGYILLILILIVSIAPKIEIIYTEHKWYECFRPEPTIVCKARDEGLNSASELNFSDWEYDDFSYTNFSNSDEK